jgi:cell division protease FtsH
VDFEILAKRTPGFTGADLASVVNEAALLSVRFGKTEIGADEMEEAIQRVMSGPRRRGHLLSADERKRAAFHEAGHAVVAAALGRLEGSHRVTIMARGRSLGEAAMDRSLKDRSLLSRSELLTELVCSLAGIAAEELVLGEPSTGGEGDLVRANVLAELIVGRFGMSQNLGKLLFIETEGGEFMGGEAVPRGLTTGPVLMEMHQEVRRVIDQAEGRAQSILLRHRSFLDRLSAELEERESIDGVELESMLEPVKPEMNLSFEGLAPTSNGARPSSRESHVLKADD